MGFERLAEEKIREAIEQGMFSNLAGQGKPLPDMDDGLAGDMWMGLHILRENGFLPEWLELRKQVFVDREQVLEAERNWRSLHERWGYESHPLVRESHDRYLRHVRDINAKIDLHNIRCPAIQLEIARFRDSV